ncbi:MAG: aminotransferase class V-fold PLP-dependent enzyme [Rhodospirillaceae bacterium]
MTANSQPPCYLDYAASAPLRPEVRVAMAEAMVLTGNPSSPHRFGRTARAALEAARRQVAALAGAAPAGVVFTSGGSEANTLALTGLAVGSRIVSAIEHESVLAAAPGAVRLPVTADGVADLAALEALLARLPAPVLLSLMRVNNETGVIQPVAEAAALVHRAGGLVHCDAVQAAGRLPLDRAALGADLLTLSAHKLGGPAGVGALILDERLALAPLIPGGGQERRRRGGTENLIGIIGFGAAAALAAASLADTPRLAALRDHLECAARRLAPDVVIFGARAPRAAGLTCLARPGRRAETLVMALDLAGVAVSAGAACSSGKTRASAVLTAMAVDDALARCAIRVSLGWASGERDVERFLAAWGEVKQRP